MKFKPTLFSQKKKKGLIHKNVTWQKMQI